MLIYNKNISMKSFICTHHANNKNSGFTIVELLIVIVVIGILAAITIVAYNGIAQRATVATLVSDLNGASKRLKLDQVTSTGYPATTSLADNGNGLKASAGTTYQYTVDNTVNPQTFCLTATNGTTSYYSNQSGSPQPGACSASVTNLANNPSCESNVTNWASNGGSFGTAVLSQGTTGFSGTATCMQTSTVASTGVGGGPNIAAGGASNITASVPYTISGYVRVSKIQRVALSFRWLNSSGGSIGSDIVNPTPIITAPNVWQRTSYTLTAPANATQVRYFFYAVSGTSAANWAVGDTMEVDAVMVNSGSTLYNYADGNTPGWAWSGATNNSPSTGPPV
jgi:prepilin-type N-terminal cleavage/methylation domain-containing protein